MAIGLLARRAPLGLTLAAHGAQTRFGRLADSVRAEPARRRRRRSAFVRPAVVPWPALLLLLCVGLAAPTHAAAQTPDATDVPDSPVAVWVMTGLDLAVGDRWRGLVRLGHLGDIESRIVLTESAFVARPDLHLIAGYVSMAPTASDTRTTLLRAGGTWRPIRRRLTVENRLLVERRRTTATAPSFRMRDRLRLLYARPVNVPLTAFGSIELIAAEGAGLVERRIQLGATRSVGPLAVESYWLHRRLPGRRVVDGFGLTASWRIGG